ncbi:DNA polymerase V [Shewanella sairae]|uniref:DNA polymerase V n=1 Tax=Shewanella sairae TaxID=190310 RepID=A0ABQ4PS24_9GAMM|nr:S24 family peptidase [Shewanella sairae]MCL1132709.1 S24 family peptidase [Shewanella sairae]GIU52858.1 DNA polymerase V [Shewanella sairae]
MNKLLTPIHCGITGFGSPAAEYRQLPLSLDELLIEHPSATFLGYAAGQSMQGVGIFDGDILIVDRHVTAQNGDIVVAILNGEFICKTIDTDNHALLSNPVEDEPCKIHEFDDFVIEGVVVRSIRYHRPSPLLSN